MKSRLKIILILLLAFILRLYLLGKIEGFLQGDPIEYSDIAIHVVYGLPLEGTGMRSYFYPLVLSIPLLFFKHIYNTLGDLLVTFLRIVQILISLITIYATYIVGTKIRNKEFGIVSALILSVNPIFLKWSISTVPSIITSLFLLLSIYFFYKKRYFISGILIGLAFMGRYQSIIFLLPFCLLLSFKDIKKFLFGFLIVFCIQGFLDLLTYGSLFISMFNFLNFQFFSGYGKKIAEICGIYQGPFWYFMNFKYWISPLGILFIIFSIFNFKNHDRVFRLLSILFLTTFVILSFIPIKSIRYFVPIIPAISFLISETLIKLKRKWGLFPYFLLTFLIILGNLNTITHIDLSYAKSILYGTKYVTWIGNQQNKTLKFATIRWATGGLYYYSNRVKIIDLDPVFWDNKTLIRKIKSEVDYVLIWKNFHNMSIIFEFSNEFIPIKDYGDAILMKKRI